MLMRNLLFVISMVFFVLSGCSSIHLNESDLLLSSGRGQIPDAIPANYRFDEHFLQRADNSIAYGVSVRSAESRGTVLYFGGNDYSIDNLSAGTIRYFTSLGLDIFIFDRRGYGRSTGTAQAAYLASDATYIFDFVQQQVCGQLIVHGHSLGGFEAAAVAKVRNVSALVLEATTTNIDEWSSSLVPWYAKPFVTLTVADELRVLDNNQSVATQKAPLLLLVGGRDKQTPEYLMRRLYDNSVSSVREYLVVNEAGHNNILAFNQAKISYMDFLATAKHKKIVGGFDDHFNNKKDCVGLGDAFHTHN